MNENKVMIDFLLEKGFKEKELYLYKFNRDDCKSFIEVFVHPFNLNDLELKYVSNLSNVKDEIIGFNRYDLKKQVLKYINKLNKDFIKHTTDIGAMHNITNQVIKIVDNLNFTYNEQKKYHELFLANGKHVVLINKLNNDYSINYLVNRVDVKYLSKNISSYIEYAKFKNKSLLEVLKDTILEQENCIPYLDGWVYGFCDDQTEAYRELAETYIETPTVLNIMNIILDKIIDRRILDNLLTIQLEKPNFFSIKIRWFDASVSRQQKYNNLWKTKLSKFGKSDFNIIFYGDANGVFQIRYENTNTDIDNEFANAYVEVLNDVFAD
jgi:hypothetical protein